MLRRIFRRWKVPGLFNEHFIEARAMYVQEFNLLPSTFYIGGIDASLVFEHIKTTLGNDIVNIYQHSYFNHDENQLQFVHTILVLTGNRVIELGVNYCQVLYTPTMINWAQELAGQLAGYRIVQKEPVIGFSMQTLAN